MGLGAAEVTLGVLPVGLSEFVGDVPDPVGPAAPDGDVGICEGQGGGKAVRANHFEAFAGGTAPVGGGGRALPFVGAFAAGGLEVDDLLAPVGEKAEGDRNGMPDGVRNGLACRHHAGGHEGLAAGVEAAVGGGDGIRGLGRTLTVVMVGTGAAVADADAMAAVGGIDVLLIGTNDLCASMGIPGRYGAGMCAFRACASARFHPVCCRTYGVTRPVNLRRMGFKPAIPPLGTRSGAADIRASLLGRRAGRLVPARNKALDQVDLAFQARHALAQIPKLCLNPLESLLDPLEPLVDPLELLVDPLEPLVHMCGQKVDPAVQPRTLAENERCEGDADGDDSDEFGRKRIHAFDHRPANPARQQLVPNISGTAAQPQPPGLATGSGVSGAARGPETEAGRPHVPRPVRAAAEPGPLRGADPAATTPRMPVGKVRRRLPDVRGDLARPNGGVGPAAACGARIDPDGKPDIRVRFPEVDNPCGRA